MRLTGRLTGRLADYAEAKKVGGILGDVRAHLLREADKSSGRRHDVIHPSEMASHEWCPRRTFYRIRDVRLGKKWTGERHGARTLAIFEEGHHIHHKWQGWLRDMGVLQGRWDCRECDSRGIAWGFDPGECHRCGSRTGVVYGEVPLDAEKEHLIVGSSDGWVSNSLIEIKGIATGTLRIDAPDLLREHTHKLPSGKTVVDINSLWESLNRPLPAHNRQGHLYLYLAKLVGLPVESLIFIYECKVNQQVKEFEIRLSERIVAPLLEKAESISNALISPARYPPPERAFSDPDKRPCKSCEFAKECYAESGADQGQPDLADGDVQPVRAFRPRRRAVADAARFDRAGRPGADDPVRRDDGVGRVPRRIAVEGRGRRAPRGGSA